MDEIKDQKKYADFYVAIEPTLRAIFSTLNVDAFNDYYSTAFMEGFLTFEKNYNPEKSDDGGRGFCYIIVKNNMYTALRKKSEYTLGENESMEKLLGDDGEQIIEQMDAATGNAPLTNKGFWAKSIMDKLSLDNLPTSTPELKKSRDLSLMFVKREAWAIEKELSENTIDLLAAKVKTDTRSAEYFDIHVPLPIIRLRTWSIFSKF